MPGDSIPGVGTKYGTWVVLDEPVRIGLQCAACGAKRRIRITDLTAVGACHRCGAPGPDRAAGRVDRGGESKHSLYKTWIQIRYRCGPTTTNPNDRARYYERGIRVCPEWDNSYETFRDWALSNGWSEDLQIDRRDNDRGYSPDNCRWVTSQQNLMNRSNSRRLTAWGETKLLADWVHDPRCVTDYWVVWDRVTKGGWEPERAMTQPRLIRRNARTTEYRPTSGGDAG